MSNNNSEDKLLPPAHGIIPLWIKIMWLLGIIWLCTYIFMGLQSSPEKW